MNPESRQFTTDIAIIGSGIAGFAAGIFATNRGIPCALTGNTGAVAYTTGYLDLLGFVNSHPVETPWEEIQALRDHGDRHPLAQMEGVEIQEAFEQFTSFIGQCGITYCKPGAKNLQALTPAGTLKPTLCVPATMARGLDALHQNAPSVILGFHGLKGFSAHQIQANLATDWPSLRAGIISFPNHKGGELYAEVAARSLEVPQNRELLAEIIKREVGNAQYVGLPAILGMHNPDKIFADMERLCGISLFEIPTMPPSVAGIRLREMFEQVLPQKGLTIIPQQKVEEISFGPDAISLGLHDNHGQVTITAKTAILATGRFLSGGLKAGINDISESLIGLPVAQPSSRSSWFHKEYMDIRGHSIHLAGIETDGQLRPLAEDGSVYDERLFAAGIILAHQDWIRQRCGAGVAIATAYKAVEAAQRFLSR